MKITSPRIRLLLLFTGCIGLLYVYVQPALAVSITITSAPSIISTDNFSVNVSVDGPNPGTNYLRIDLYKEDSGHYFGETFNGNSWYGGSDGQQYLPVTITLESTTSATLQGRIGIPTSSEYPGPGAYKLRIRRYVSSDSGNIDNQTPVDVQISAVFASPTPTPVPTPAPSPEPSPEPSASSQIQMTTSPSPQIKKVSPSPIIKQTSPHPSQDIGEVLAATRGLTVDGSPNNSLDLTPAAEKPSFTLAGMFLIGGGILFSGTAGLLLYFRLNKPKLV